MYYIAGLTIPVPPQVVEGLAVLTTLRFFQYGISRTRAIAPVAKAESGVIRTSPTTFIGKAVTPIHALAFFVPSVTYVLCVTGNMFTQPAWMQRMSLSNDYFKHETKVALRIAACASTFVLLRFVRRTFTHLGNQWHTIGVRTFLNKYSREDMCRLTAVLLNRDGRSLDSCRQVHMQWCVIRYTRES
jgi:hypothetical protein